MNLTLNNFITETSKANAKYNFREPKNLTWTEVTKILVALLSYLQKKLPKKRPDFIGTNYNKGNGFVEFRNFAFSFYLRNPSRKWDQDWPLWGKLLQWLSFWSAWSTFLPTVWHAWSTATTPPPTTPSRNRFENLHRRSTVTASSASPSRARTYLRTYVRRHPRWRDVRERDASSAPPSWCSSSSGPRWTSWNERLDGERPRWNGRSSWRSLENKINVKRAALFIYGAP